PGWSWTSASRVRVSALNRVDLPTLGRPTSATSGSMDSAGWGRNAEGDAANIPRRHVESPVPGNRDGGRTDGVVHYRPPSRVFANRLLGDAEGAQFAVDVLHDEDVAIHHRHAAQGIAAGAGTGGECARPEVHPVQVAVVVADDRVAAVDRGCRQVATGQRRLGPERGAAALVQSMDAAVGGADDDHAVSGGDPAGAAMVAEPH